MTEVIKPGWDAPVGWVPHPVSFEVVHKGEFIYHRTVLSNLRLSLPAALFLLQGASLRELLSGVLLCTPPVLEPFSITLSSAPNLVAPPPTLPRVAMAHIIERPVSVPVERLLQEVTMNELRRLALD